MIFTDFGIFGNFLICFCKFYCNTEFVTATHVILLWNLSRNPDKISSKIRRKNAKFDAENEKNRKFIFFIREKMLTIFG